MIKQLHLRVSPITIHSDDALAEYLQQIALEDAGLHVNATSPPISGTALETLGNEYRLIQRKIKYLNLGELGRRLALRLLQSNLVLAFL